MTTIAFQGSHGAFSDLVARKMFPRAKTLPCVSFEDTFAALKAHEADFAAIPVENSIAGRVSDVYHLLPRAGMFIHGEHFEAINHCLLGLPHAKLSGIRHAHSHIMALSQCRRYLMGKDITPHVFSDTAAAAQWVAQQGDESHAAIASHLAASLYNLSVLDEDIADTPDNTTRFLIIANEPAPPPPPHMPAMTSLFFDLRSVPAALYKALGGFATNGINLLKIESYFSGSDFQIAHFYVDVAAHQHSPAMDHALEELSFYSKAVKILGCYPQSPHRQAQPDERFG
jgi:prephenate dehydratase